MRGRQLRVRQLSEVRDSALRGIVEAPAQLAADGAESEIAVPGDGGEEEVGMELDVGDAEHGGLQSTVFPDGVAGEL